MQMIHLACSLLGMGASHPDAPVCAMVFWALDGWWHDRAGLGKFMGLGEPGLCDEQIPAWPS